MVAGSGVGVGTGGAVVIAPTESMSAPAVVPVGLPSVAQALQAIRQRPVIRHDSAAVAQRAQVLRGVEAEGSQVTPGAGHAAGQGCTVRLSTVFDHV